MTKFAFFQGKIVPIEQAQVSIMTHALQYGTGCFEGIRGYWNETQKQIYIFRLQEHFERLQQSAKILGIAIPYSVEEMENSLLDLIRKEAYQEDIYIRPFVYKSGCQMGVCMKGVESDFAIYSMAFGRYIENEEGAHVVVSSWRRNNDNSLPARAKVTGGYINSALAKTEAVMNGFDEAIVLNDDGKVSEGSAENLFLYRNGKLITPAVSENILEGITRNTVIQLAREKLNMQVEERSVSRTELYVADEAFFCGTGVQIAAIASIDRRPIGDGKMGPLVKQMREYYFDIVRGNQPKYLSWCTPTY